MKKTTKNMNNNEEIKLVAPGSRYKFGNERLGIIRRFFSAIKHTVKPETSVDDGDLWVMFRTKENKAMQIAKSVADTIEIDYSRVNGEEFLSAFAVVCRACTPDCINKIFKMMFRKPVYFSKSFGSDVLRWIISLPTTSDKNITIDIKPVKVDYLTEFCIRAILLTDSGPYISAKFETSQESESPLITTTGVVELYVPARRVFFEEWDLPGVIRYTVVVSVTYMENTTLGTNEGLIMEIIRRCAADVLSSEPLWIGYFGEDRPQKNKKSKPYYQAELRGGYDIPFDTIEDMTQVGGKVTSIKTVEFSAMTDAPVDTGLNVKDSNFDISGDRTEVSPKEKSFMITVYPPLKDRPRKTPINTMVDVHHDGNSSAKQSENEQLDIMEGSEDNEA